MPHPLPASLALLLVLAGPGGTQADASGARKAAESVGDHAPSRLLPSLAQVLAETPPDEPIAAYVVFADRPDYAALGNELAALPRGARGKALAARLRLHDGAHRESVLALLREREADGSARRLVDLSAVNALAFEAVPALVRAVAAAPGVLYVAHDFAAPVGSTADVEPAPPPAAASLPPMSLPPASLVPTTPLHLQNLNVPAAWALGYDGTGITVALLDDGTADDHPSLASHIWSSPGEIPGNGIDDDFNGFVDDVRGWNFASLSNNTYGQNHGTRTAGLLVGDGSLVDTGGQSIVTGTATGAKLMLTVIHPSAATQSSFWACQQYAMANGADLISSSHSFKWFVGFFPDYFVFRSMTEALLAAGILQVNSTGNQGTSTGSFPVPFNVATPGNCPGPWVHPSQVKAGVAAVVSCAAITLDNAIVPSSCVGPAAWEDISLYTASYPFLQNATKWDYPYALGTKPGLLKPDVAAYSGVPTTTGNAFYLSSFTGTSAATPQVAGVAALMLSANPTLEPRHIAHVLQATCTDLGPVGKDLRYGAGRVNAFAAVKRGSVSVTSVPQVPKLGTNVTFRGHTLVGKPSYLAISLTNTPLVVPGIGTLDVNVPIEVIADVQSPATADLDYFVLPIPAEPLLTGYTFFLQAGVDDTSGATGEWLISPIETFTIGSF